MAPQLLPLFTLVDRRRRLYREIIEAYPERLMIPYASMVEQTAARRLPIAVSASGSAAAVAHAALWAAVETQLALER